MLWCLLSVNIIGEPAVAGARSLAERQLKIYSHKGMVRWMKWVDELQNKAEAQPAWLQLEAGAAAWAI